MLPSCDIESLIIYLTPLNKLSNVSIGEGMSSDLGAKSLISIYEELFVCVMKFSNYFGRLTNIFGDLAPPSLL